MQLNLTPAKNTGYKQPVDIYILGSGLTLDLFNFSRIKEKDIVITTNAAIPTFPKPDYYLFSNWYSARSSLLQFTDPKKTTIICYSDLKPNPVISASDYFMNDNLSLRYFIERTNELFLNHKPIIMDFDYDIDVLADPDNIVNAMEKDRLIPAWSGSGPPCFMLAYYLTKKLNVNKIYYVGFDLITTAYNCELVSYPYILRDFIIIQKTLDKNLAEINLDKLKFKSAFSYKYQHSGVLIAAGLDINFYNKLHSLSIPVIEDTPFIEINKAVKQIIKDCKAHNKKHFNLNDLDSIYRLTYKTTAVNNEKIKARLNKLIGNKKHSEQGLRVICQYCGYNKPLHKMAMAKSQGGNKNMCKTCEENFRANT